MVPTNPPPQPQPPTALACACAAPTRVRHCRCLSPCSPPPPPTHPHRHAPSHAPSGWPHGRRRHQPSAPPPPVDTPLQLPRLNPAPSPASLPRRHPASCLHPAHSTPHAGPLLALPPTQPPPHTRIHATPSFRPAPPFTLRPHSPIPSLPHPRPHSSRPLIPYPTTSTPPQTSRSQFPAPSLFREVVSADDGQRLTQLSRHPGRRAQGHRQQQLLDLGLSVGQERERGRGRGGGRREGGTGEGRGPRSIAHQLQAGCAAIRARLGDLEVWTPAAPCTLSRAHTHAHAFALVNRMPPVPRQPPPSPSPVPPLPPLPLPLPPTTAPASVHAEAPRRPNRRTPPPRVPPPRRTFSAPPLRTNPSQPPTHPPARSPRPRRTFSASGSGCAPPYRSASLGTCGRSRRGAVTCVRVSMRVSVCGCVCGWVWVWVWVAQLSGAEAAQWRRPSWPCGCAACRQARAPLLNSRALKPHHPPCPPSLGVPHAAPPLPSHAYT